MTRFFYALAFLGALTGVVIVVLTFLSAKGAPQEAAGFALALCAGVLPYVSARAIEKIGPEK